MRIWIMDGHNMIFRTPPLRELQVSGRGEEARRQLTDRLEAFAVARGRKVMVVFDGNELASNPDAVRTPHFEVVYTRRGDAEADDLILREARRRDAEGRAVTVVTDDRNTLAARLPRGVGHVGVAEFWLKHIEKDARDREKRIEGDFSDLEREMLAQAERAGTGRIETSAAFRPTSAADRGSTGAIDETRERILSKRERGRRRQQRRLERHRKRRR